MKLDLNKKQTLGSKRTLKQLRDTLGTLLCEKSFDMIQVTEICERSMIPKSTFYNYFEDKYDLLHYFMKFYELEINADITEPDSVDILNNLLDAIEKYWKSIEKIFRYNPPTGYFYQEYQRFFMDSCYRVMMKNQALHAHDALPAAKIPHGYNAVPKAMGSAHLPIPHPFFIFKMDLRQICQHAGSLRPFLRKKCIGITFHHPFSVRTQNTIFIICLSRVKFRRNLLKIHRHLPSCFC